MLIYILIITLMILTYIFWSLSGKDALSTPVLLCYVFIICLGICIPNLTFWSLDMSDRTFAVILIGISAFALGYFIIFNVLIQIYAPKYVSNLGPSLILRNKYIWIVFTLIQGIYLYIFYEHVQTVVGDSTFAEQAYAFRLLWNHGDEEAEIPFYLRELRRISSFGSLLLAYKMLHDFYLYDILQKKYLLNILLYIMASLISGARGQAVMYVMAIGILAYIMTMQKNNWNIHIKINTIFKVLVVGVVSLYGFILSAVYILGRNATWAGSTSFSEIFSGVSYGISVYLGAEIKLLDLFLTDTYTTLHNYDLPGRYTLNSLYNYLANQFGFNYAQIQADALHEHMYVHGTTIGNVYTMFAEYYADAGYFGVAIFSAIMGMFFGWIYYKVKYNNHAKLKRNIDMYMIVYASFYFTIALAFFANWFYITVGFSIFNFLIHYYCLIWIMFKRNSQSHITLQLVVR